MKKNIFVLLMIQIMFILTNCTPLNTDPSISHDIPTASEVGMPFFTSLPLDTNSFSGFVPLGSLNPPSHTFPTDHHYFYLTDPTNRVPVYTPGTVWVTRVQSSLHSNANFTDYSITFYSCSELRATYGHLSSLSNQLKTAYENATDTQKESYSTGGETYVNITREIFLKLPAHEIIGTAGGNTGQYAMDFGVYDSRTNLTFINSSRFYSDYTHAVPCIGYYETNLQSYLNSRAGDYDGSSIRTNAPIGGTVEQDIASTVQGIWFNTAFSTYPEDSHLALVHDNVDVSQPIFSIGNSIPGLSAGTYTYSIASSGLSNRDFNSIHADSNIYTFHDVAETHSAPGSQVILLTMSNLNTLYIEVQDETNGPPWNFSSNEVQFER